MTNVDIIMPDVVEDVPVTGTATLDFQDSRVTLLEFSVSFEGLGELEFRDLISLDGSLSVTGGGGLLSGGVLSFDQPSFAALTLTCNGRQELCDVLGPGTVVGMPRPAGMRGPFLLADFVFDADGNFTTVQSFERLLPLGVSSGMASMTQSASRSVTLRATQVPEPTALQLVALAMLGIASARGRRR
jgi:hypothetical protein